MMTLESLPRAYAPAEVEAITRFILRDQPVRITSGEWWGYSPDGAILTYPRFVLSLWPGDRVVGAVCHEVAEALFSGPDAARVFEEFGRRAARLGCETRSAELLLNAINDLRVNRLYLAAYPGSAPFLRAVYASGTELHRKDDQPAAQPGAVVMPHHQFVDALTCRWAREQWGLEAPKPTLDPVQRALDQCWPAIRLAIAQDALASLADRVADSVLATYHALIRLGQEMLAEAARRAAEAPEEEPEPRSESDDEEAPEDERFVVPEEPVEVWVHLDEDQTTEGERKRDNERESGRSPSPQPPAPNPQS
ncbi:MAG: hypothetical protein HYY04_00070, partial [Chloroflexi bacterium]|nr:hypothetical protein [Chloroflexota bacterium]